MVLLLCSLFPVPSLAAPTHTRAIDLNNDVHISQPLTLLQAAAANLQLDLIQSRRPYRDLDGWTATLRYGSSLTAGAYVTVTNTTISTRDGAITFHLTDTDTNTNGTFAAIVLLYDADSTPYWSGQLDLTIRATTATGSADAINLLSPLDAANVTNLNAALAFQAGTLIPTNNLPAVVLSGGTPGDKGDITVGATWEIDAGVIGSNELNAAGVESALEAVLDLQDLQGAVTDAQVPDTITLSNYIPKLNGLSTNLTLRGDVKLEQWIYHEGDTDTTIEFEDDAVEFRAGNVTFIRLDESTADYLYINHQHVDLDLVVGGGTDAYLLYGNSGTDRVGIGTNSPASKLHVVGTVTATEFAGGGASLTAVDAATGDSATGFFDAGTIEHERGGLEADVSAYTGLLGIQTGSAVEVDTVAEFTTALALTGTPGATTYLRGDGAWAAVVGVTDANKGHITVTGSGTNWTINGAVVTPAMLDRAYVTQASGSASNITLYGTTTLAAGATLVGTSNMTLSVSNIQAQAIGLSNYGRITWSDSTGSFIGPVSGSDYLNIQESNNFVRVSTNGVHIGSNIYWYGTLNTAIAALNVGGPITVTGEGIIGGGLTITGAVTATTSVTASDLTALDDVFVGDDLTATGSVIIAASGNASGESNPLVLKLNEDTGAVANQAYIQAYVSDSGEPVFLYVHTNIMANLNWLGAAPSYATDGQRILTTWDEGPAQGLDADTVDGVQASGFSIKPQLYNLATNRTWTASELRNARIRVTATSTQTVAAVSTDIYDSVFTADGTNVVLTIKPNASDGIRRNGVTGADGTGIVSDGTADAMAIVEYYSAAAIKVTTDGNWTP